MIRGEKMNRTKYITVTQAAKKLNVGTQTIYNMLQDGRLGGRYHKGVGKAKGSWSVAVESIELFEEATEIKSIYQIKKCNQGTLF